MKIVIEEQADQSEIEVVIRCRTVDAAVLKIAASLQIADKKLTGVKDGDTHLIPIDDIFYFDTVDKRSFLYTAKEVFETGLKLYEIEQLSPTLFFRSSKSCVLNIAKIKSLMPDFGGRLRVTMANGEQLKVSRAFAQQLKTLLGI